jgi:hypothetical protein
VGASLSQPAPLDRLFLHFFDIHYLNDLLDSGNATRDQIRGECAVATRLALLCAETVFVPAASYFENDICREVVDSFRDVFPAGSLVIVAGSGSPREFAEEKLEQYDEKSVQAASYQELLAVAAEAPAYRPRQRSATTDVTTAWLHRAEAPRFAEEMFGSATRADWDRLANRWMQVPKLLNGKAFTPEYAGALLMPNPSLSTRRRVAGHINGSYFASYSDELHAGYVTDLVFLESGADLTTRFGNLPMKRLREELRRANVLDRVLDASGAELVALREEREVAMLIVDVLQVVPDGPPVNPLRLDELEPDLQLLLSEMKKVRPGTESATTYHQRAADLMTQLLHPHVGPAQIEANINEKRKRLDVLWPNLADSRFFGWLLRAHNAKYIIGECKNYSSDPKNPEIDQLLGRFAPTRSEVGFLLCRRVVNRETATARCRDAYQAGRGLVVILDDDDFTTLVSLSNAADFDASSVTGWIHRERIVPIC